MVATPAGLMVPRGCCLVHGFSLAGDLLGLKLEQVAELVVLALIDEVLAVNLTKLVIVAEYLNLEGD